MNQLLTMLTIALLSSACALAQSPVPPTAPATVQPAVQHGLVDQEPDVTAQVRSILEQVASGSLAADGFTERGRTALAAPANDSVRLLRPCSPVPTPTLLQRHTKGEDRMYVYRIDCKDKPLLVDIDFGKGSRIKRLEVRAQ